MTTPSPKVYATAHGDFHAPEPDDEPPPLPPRRDPAEAVRMARLGERRAWEEPVEDGLDPIVFVGRWP